MTSTADIAKIRTHAERAVPDRAAEFLSAGIVAHVAIVQDGQPFVLPMIYHFDPAVPDRLYLHGGHASRLLQHMGSGARICVEVTLVDGMVYSRSALYHSTNYRSVICFGAARLVEHDAVKNAVFEKMIARYFRGRTAGKDYFAATEAELRATAMVEMRIEQVSAKMRTGGPAGPHDRDAAAAGNCGVVELPRVEAGV